MEDFPTLPPLEQYAVLTGDAGCVPLGRRTQIELAGADRAVLLQNLCTNDILRLKPGAGCEAFVTSAQGKILGHVLVFCGDNSLWLETVADQADALLPHFDKYIIREDVELRDRSRDFCEMLLAGPHAAKVWGNVGRQPLPAGLCDHVIDEVGGHTVSVRRVAMTARPGFLISIEAEQVDALADVLRDAGAAACGLDVFEQVRVEAGWPLFGRDITAQNLPQEVDRDSQAISFEKGCYLGQETVAHIDAVGHVNRKLVGVQFDAADVPASGLKLCVADKEVGQITSAVYSPLLKAALALGYVRREHSEPDSRLESASGPARVIRLPLRTSLTQMSAFRKLDNLA